MNDLFIVLLFSLIGGLVSLGGGFLLLANKRVANKLIKYITPFAAGALLAAAFLDVLVEAGHQGSFEQALRWALIGILGFFLLERFLRWFHHHHSHRSEPDEPSDATAPLIIVGDTVHNFIDGIAIGAAFLIDVPTGIITTLAVAAHEIPQEIGDFGLLLSKGMSRGAVVKANILSSLATTLAAVGFYSFAREAEIQLGIVLGLVAGFFIYIAVSDIIPSIHKTEERKLAGFQTAMLIVGVLVVGAATTTLHGLIDSSAEHESHSSEHGHEDEHHDHDANEEPHEGR